MSRKSRNHVYKTLEKLEQQGGVCFWCLRRPYPFESIHADHVVAEQRGGVFTVAACMSCNIHKDTHSFDAFYIRRMIELAKLIHTGRGEYAFSLIGEIDFVLFEALILQGAIPFDNEFLIHHCQPDSKSSVRAMLIQLSDSENDCLFDVTTMLSRKQISLFEIDSDVVREMSFREWEYWREEDRMYNESMLEAINCLDTVEDKLSFLVNQNKDIEDYRYKVMGDRSPREAVIDNLWRSGQLGKDILGQPIQID